MPKTNQRQPLLPFPNWPRCSVCGEEMTPGDVSWMCEKCGEEQLYELMEDVTAPIPRDDG